MIRSCKFRPETCITLPYLNFKGKIIRGRAGEGGKPKNQKLKLKGTAALLYAESISS